MVPWRGALESMKILHHKFILIFQKIIPKAISYNRRIKLPTIFITKVTKSLSIDLDLNSTSVLLPTPISKTLLSPSVIHTYILYWARLLMVCNWEFLLLCYVMEL